MEIEDISSFDTNGLFFFRFSPYGWHISFCLLVLINFVGSDLFLLDGSYFSLDDYMLLLYILSK